MPLHDWRDDRGWAGLNILWQAQLLDWVQQRLPAGYRAYLGSVPALTIDVPNDRPDLGVRQWESGPTAGAGSTESPGPDTEAVAVFELDPQTAVHIDLHGRLVAAIELVSPRNKDRPDARERYLGRYLGYVRQGVHLMLVDLLPRPADFSFADALAANLRFDQPPCPAPFAVSYRVGEPVPEGTILGVWRRPLRVGDALPTIPVALTVRESILIDLEHTYREAARRVYLD
jgi:Protein of unknown function (DUF4058)